MRVLVHSEATLSCIMKDVGVNPGVHTWHPARHFHNPGVNESQDKSYATLCDAWELHHADMIEPIAH